MSEVGNATESIVIRNNGRLVDIADWAITINDESYTLTSSLIFSNSEFTIYTGVGRNTPIASYLGESQPLLGSNDIIVLSDADGEVRSNLYVTE